MCLSSAYIGFPFIHIFMFLFFPFFFFFFLFFFWGGGYQESPWWMGLLFVQIREVVSLSVFLSSFMHMFLLYHHASFNNRTFVLQDDPCLILTVQEDQFFVCLVDCSNLRLVRNWVKIIILMVRCLVCQLLYTGHLWIKYKTDNLKWFPFHYQTRIFLLYMLLHSKVLPSLIS